MKRTVPTTALILMLLTLSACSLLSDPLTRFVNAKFPPVDVDQQRDRAIATTAEALAKMTAPNVAFAAPVSDLERALSRQPLTDLGLTKVRLRGEEGLLRVEVEFKRRFDDAGSEASAEARGLLRRLAPEVTGKLVIFAGVTSGTASESAKHLHLNLLPVFSSVDVSRIVLAEKADVTLIGDLLASLLNRYADNITGELARSSLMDLEVPASFADPVSASRSIHVDAKDGKADITIDANPVTSPVRLLGIATLIAKEQVTTLVQLVPTASPDPPAGAALMPSFGALRRQVESVVRSSFELPSTPEGPWLAIRKDLIAASVNGALAQAGVCILANGETAQQRLSQQITFPDETTVDCSPTRDCTPERDCDFAPCRDTRSCNKCLIKNPFTGGCTLRGNDPGCEAAKLAENKRCEAEAALRKLDCERLKTQEKAICELEKSGEKTLCEAGKETLKRLARTGKFGNLEAGVRASTDSLRVCMKSFALASDLSHVRLDLDIDGEASADVEMKFTPLDIVGHLACQAPFTESRTFHASLRKSGLTLESEIALTTDASGAHAKFEVRDNTVPVRLQPGPTEFLLTSPNMTLACQGLNLVKPLLVSVTPFVPELRGEIDQKIPKKEITFDLDVPTQKVGGLTVKGTVQASSKSLFLFSELDVDEARSSVASVKGTGSASEVAEEIAKK